MKLSTALIYSCNVLLWAAGHATVAVETDKVPASLRKLMMILMAMIIRFQLLLSFKIDLIPTKLLILQIRMKRQPKVSMVCNCQFALYTIMCVNYANIMMYFYDSIIGVTEFCQTITARSTSIS